MFNIKQESQRLLSRLGSLWGNSSYIPLHIPRTRISRVILYIIGSVLFILWLIAYSSSRDSSVSNIHNFGSPNPNSLPEFDPLENTFHILVYASPRNPQLCRAITSAMILGYPPFTLIRQAPETRAPSSSTKDNHKENQAVIEEIQSILSFLKTNKRVRDRDLVLIIDSEDTLFQLPPDVLVDRYLEITRQKNKHLRGKYGMKVISDAENPDIHHTVQKYTQRVMFTSRKDCASNLTDSAICASVPESSLPPDIYGLKTDKKRDGTLNRPRWIEPGIIMGQMPDLVPLYERVLEEMKKQPSRASDQMIFTNIFGAQEYSREIERRKNNSPLKEWLWKSAGISEASNVTNVRAHIQPGDQHEYGMGLDYEGQLFLNTRKTLNDIEWLKYRDVRKVSSVQMAHGVPREVRLDLPLDIIQHPMNPFKKSRSLNNLPMKTANLTTIDILPASWNFTWNDLPFATYIQTAAVPAILYTGSNPDVRQGFWDSVWFRPWSRALLRNHIRSGDVQPLKRVAALGASDLLKFPERRGGMWTDNDVWMSFDDLCGGFEDAVFSDGLGRWGDEKLGGLRPVYNLWGTLIGGKGRKTKKLGESKSEAEEIEKFIFKIMADIEDDEEEDEDKE